MSTKFEQLTVTEERRNLYWKLKDACAYLASVVQNHELKVKHRLRATQALAEMAKIVRLFIMDEEKMQELENEVEKLKQLFAERMNQTQST
jgi:hypothetical protein